ncbi:MAG: RNA methyltransferase [Deltaproteobacteria bacterium]
MKTRHLAAPEPSAQSAIDNISIVLVEPQSSGNVGSVARAMKNTGFSDLVLINPCDYRNNEAYSFACKADDVLLGARRFPDLGSHIRDAGIVVGTTRRMGKARYPLLTLTEAVPRIIELASGNSVSILFGREDRGLVNEEIPLCDMLLEIPAHPDYPSLNLSQAVMIVCHHIFASVRHRAPVIEAAPRQELDKMYAHMEAALRRLGYGEKGGEALLKSILRSFRRLFGRTGLMQKEINMLRGIYTQIENRAVKSKRDD